MGSLEIKSKSAAVRDRREATCRRVLDYLHLQLSELSLLCFVDDETVDDPEFEKKKNLELGENTRGIFYDNVAESLQNGRPLPFYVEESLQPPGGIRFNQLVYVHGIACEPEVSLILTLSHELQHFLQYKNERQAFLDDRSLNGKLQCWQDHPREYEAMLVSKQVATALCDEGTVNQYIQSRIDIFEKERKRWEFIGNLPLSENYDFPKQVSQLVEK
jgi:hypothetical protein